MRFLGKGFVLGAISLCVWQPGLVRGETFSFGSDQNGLSNPPGMASKVFIGGGFAMAMSAHPSGGLLRESFGSSGLGVDSSALLPATTDASAFSISRLGGSGPLAGTSEYVQFSFDKPGVLTGINFDGLSDERLEYFRLETDGGVRYNFFDSAADTTVPGAVTAANLPGIEVLLLEILGGPIDEALGLSIPFAAGQVFTLTYDDLGAAHGALLAGNGGSLQGLTVVSVPEPAAFLLAVVACATFVFHRIWR